jgi:hypothetical protein
MKAALLACVLLGLTCQAFAADDFGMVEDQARFLYFNTSSSASSLTLLGALILLGVIAYLVYAGGLLGSSSYNRNDYYGQYSQYDQAYENAYPEFRSANNGFASNLNVLNWIAMLQELYENFDYNDLDCQKRLICEVMREPEYYGSVAQKFKSGFQYAKFLEVLSLPDDMRELLDEYLDANSRSDQQKDCAEFFQCPFSIRDSMKRTIGETNHL